MQNVIDKIELTFAALDGFLGWFFGDLDGFLYALIIFVVMDYFTGILAAGVKKELSSAVGFKGIAKKVCIFVLVGIANNTNRYRKSLRSHHRATVRPIYRKNVLVDTIRDLVASAERSGYKPGDIAIIARKNIEL